MEMNWLFDEGITVIRPILWAACVLYLWFSISRYLSRKRQHAQLVEKEEQQKKQEEKQKKLEEKRNELISKYGDPEIADAIMDRQFWQGQTDEQLVDSIGQPVDVDRKVMKRKTSEVWKYHETGKGRFALRIKLENGVVVGWDKKA